jgi:hypothetical protein
MTQWHDKGKYHVFTHADSRGGSTLIQAHTKEEALLIYVRAFKYWDDTDPEAEANRKQMSGNLDDDWMGEFSVITTEADLDLTKDQELDWSFGGEYNVGVLYPVGFPRPARLPDEADVAEWDHVQAIAVWDHVQAIAVWDREAFNWETRVPPTHPNGVVSYTRFDDDAYSLTVMTATSEG